MFITVNRYGEQYQDNKQGVTIFDTDDLTVETISFDEWKNSGVEVKCIDSVGRFHSSKFRQLEHCFRMRRRTKTTRFYIKPTNLKGFKYEIDNLSLMFSTFRDHFIVYITNNKRQNKEEIDILKKVPIYNHYLLYVYEWRDYYVLRFCFTFTVTDSYVDFYTMILDKSGKILSLYNISKEFVYGDKGLAVQLDIIRRE